MRIYIQGTFDLFHAGHINLLKRANELGDVVVALLTDELVERYRGKPPIISYENRKACLESCEYVDIIIPIDDLSKTKDQIRGYECDLVALGTDWAIKDIYKQYRMTEKELGPKLIFFPYTKDISSTSIKKRINELT